jgi:carboxymethylenebutenolidase
MRGDDTLASCRTVSGAENAMIEKSVPIPAASGSIDAFICHPERRRPAPGVVFYMDAPGIREELYDMARRIAAVGYYVILPNLYYRHGPGTTPGPAAADESSADHKRMFELMLSLDNGTIAEDTASLLAFLDRQPEVRRERLGCVGYCMSGPFAVTAAARFPERFNAAASLHGVPLVTDQPDSPHRVLGHVKAELYFGFGESDPLTPAKDIDAMKAALEKTSLRYELEIYEGAGHGFVFPQRSHYHKAHAERHWERLFDLFGRNLS